MRSKNKHDVNALKSRSRTLALTLLERINATPESDAEATSGSESKSPAAKSKQEDLPVLKSRTTPRILYDAIKKFTAEQKSAVESLGFGSILQLSIKEVPQVLSHWLVSNFDPQSCELILQRDRRLHIDENDVSLIMGFPSGAMRIEKKYRCERCNLTKQWQEKFARNEHRIRPIDVSDKMEEDKAGGKWFKVHFMVLLTNSLIESTGNGYVHPQLVHIFDDVDRICEYNWCEYTIRCLVQKALLWRKKRDKGYNGPIMFLMQLELKLGGFGGGHIYGPYVEDDCGRKAEHNIIRLEVGSQHAVDAYLETNLDAQSDNPTLPTANDPVQEYAQKLIDDSKRMAEAMSTLMKTIEGVPQYMMDNLFFKKSYETAQQLLIKKQPSPMSQASQTQTQPQATPDDDEFWSDPVRIAAIEEIERALAKRAELEKIYADEGPTFSLGLSDA
ncbi:hypothetical protein C2S51_030722 [Perilla frutescens var. frutescens]|nr:hypothetical protein C2S51_030722 [Perilla frutescens var. frutescens]